MRCNTIREAISAELDGEDRGIERSLVDAHLRRCAECREFAAQAADMSVGLRYMPPATPDLTSRVVGRFEDRNIALLMLPVRLGLVLVGIAQLVLAVPSLVFGADEGAPVHIAHEAGSWDLALAVAFLFAAWRPLRALGLLPFVAVLSACLGITAVVDLLHGHAVAVLETSHLMELAGTVLLWLLTHPVARRHLERRARLTIA